MSIGKNIQRFRKERKLTQEELAKRIGISKSHMSKIEIDNKKPSMEILIKLANILNIPLDYFVGNVDIDDFSQLKEMLFKQKEGSEKIRLEETMLKLDISKRINKIKSTGCWSDADTMIILNELALLQNKPTSIEMLKNYISSKDYDINKLTDESLNKIDRKFSDILELEFYKLKSNK